jgi:hypothetical protein
MRMRAVDRSLIKAGVDHVMSTGTRVVAAREASRDRYQIVVAGCTPRHPEPRLSYRGFSFGGQRLRRPLAGTNWPV